MNSFTEGQVLLINKPLTWTSFQVVKKIKYLLKKNLGISTKIGHAGTLDPLATGLLIVCTGKFTKRINEFQDREKEYTGTFFLGATTPCYDLEKPVDKEYPTSHITNEMILEATKKFTGKISQIPPIFSAVKVNGKRAYKSARAGEEVEIKAKEITISSFEFTKIDMPHLHFKIVCSKGTYIRAIARDLGEHLQSGAHLTSLCRTRIGEFKIEDAKEIKDFEEEVLSIKSTA